MIGLYIDLTKVDNTNNNVKNEIIKQMPPAGIWYDSNNFWNSNILIFSGGKGLPARLMGCNSENDAVFVGTKIQCRIFGRTRVLNFMKYIKDPYNEIIKHENRIK